MVLLVPIFVACTKGVEIPRADIDDPKYREEGSYRIRMKGWEEYLVKRFSVTDSTLVIEELSSGDERFRMGRENLPYVLPLSQVVSVGRVKTNVPGTLAIVLVVGALAAFLVALSSVQWVD